MSGHGALATVELARLTHWKWRYALVAAGFTRAEAGHLTFWRWLVAAGRVDS